MGKYIQSQQSRHVTGAVLVPLLLTFNKFCTKFYCLHCFLYTRKNQLDRMNSRTKMFHPNLWFKVKFAVQ